MQNDENYVLDENNDFHVAQDGNNFVIDDPHHSGHSLLGGHNDHQVHGWHIQVRKDHHPLDNYYDDDEFSSSDEYDEEDDWQNEMDYMPRPRRHHRRPRRHHIMSNDENDEDYECERRLHNLYTHLRQGRRFRPSRYESPQERDIREHYEHCLQKRRTIEPPSHYYDYAPYSHRIDPYDMHYDPWLPFERLRSESRPHWTDDDEGYTMDFAM